MAEFQPTEAEKAAASYLDWDDAALGKFCKYVALVLEKHKDDAEGLHRVTAASAAMLLVATCFDSNADFMKLRLKGHTHGDVETGDWLLTVQRERAEATTWHNNAVQFPRLLAELRAAGLTTEQYETLRDSMDLTVDEIDELLERAETDWQEIKNRERGGTADASPEVVGRGTVGVRLPPLAPETSDEADAFEDEPPSRCTGACRDVPEGKQWAFDNEDNPERGGCHCIFCGEDGDA